MPGDDSLAVPAPEFPVLVKRSARRRRTVSARFDAGTLVVHVPAWFTPEQERDWVENMRARMLRRGSGARASDAALASRARELSRTYLGGRAVPVSVRWVDNQRTRWGSATPAHGTIRISRPVAAMPAYVRDYVLLHELAHLLEAGHTPRFWGLLSGYPQLERARGYLAGYAAGRGLGPADPDADPTAAVEASGPDEFHEMAETDECDELDELDELDQCDETDECDEIDGSDELGGDVTTPS